MSGSVSDGYTVKYNEGTLKYQYEAKIRNLFSEEELTLSFDSYPYGRGGGDDDIPESGSPADDDVDWDSDASANAAAAAVEMLDWNGTPGSIKAVRGVSAKGAKRAVSLKWKKAAKKSLKKFDKVEIQVCPDKEFARANTVRKEVSKKKVSATVKGLSGKAKYYVRVRNVRGSGPTKKVSEWSKVTKVTTK